MAYISSMKLPDNVTYDLKDARVAVPVPADAVFTDHIFSGLAEDVDYDNTASGLSSTTVQDALDEIAEGGGSGSTGCVELTQAEYDALSREEKNADVIYLITDSPDNYLDEVFGDFASVEYTSTASKAYAVGDYLVYNSKFYKVTSAIAQGGTITVGTNVTRTTVGDEIDALKDEKYEKPSGGIPASDLSSAVQTSLGKADTAIQSDNLNAKFTWNDAGSATGTTSISLSNITFNELCIEVMIDGGINREFFYVPKIALGGMTLFLRQGGYGDSVQTSSCYVVVGVTSSSVVLNSATLFGTSRTSTSVTRVWYR